MNVHNGQETATPCAYDPVFIDPETNRYHIFRIFAGIHVDATQDKQEPPITNDRPWTRLFR